MASTSISPPKCITYVKTDTSRVAVYLDYLTPKESNALFTELTSLELIQHKLHVYGRECYQPRMSIGLGHSYSYSGATLPALKWDQALLSQQLLDRINKDFSTDLNSGIVNHYRTGDDYISAHSDDEKTLARNKGVYGISTGSERDMVMRWKDGRAEKIKFALPVGSLFVMEGDVQKEMTHEMPKRKRVGARASLTLRKHKI